MQRPLELYRRHLTSCIHKSKGVNFTRCNCPIWVDGELSGKRFRKSIKTKDWGIALRRVEQLERSPETATIAPTISAALKLYIADLSARGTAQTTTSKYARTINAYIAQLPKNSQLTDISIEGLTRWRAGRKVAPSTARTEIENIRFFLNWCKKRKWIDENPASELEKPTEEGISTLPFEAQEVSALLSAIDKIDNNNKLEVDFAKRRARALVLVLLYSGLRISDVVVLSRKRLDRKTQYLFLRMEKTGVQVRVKLPEVVIAALDRLPVIHPEYYFWDGESDPKTRKGALRRALRMLGTLAGIDNVHPHRFRDTFACRLLETGAELRTVQKLLGHSSIKTTEKHYALFVASHQRLLDSATAALDFVEEPLTYPLLVDTNRNRTRNSKSNAS